MPHLHYKCKLAILRGSKRKDGDGADKGERDDSPPFIPERDTQVRVTNSIFWYTCPCVLVSHLFEPFQANGLLVFTDKAETIKLS